GVPGLLCRSGGRQRGAERRDKTDGDETDAHRTNLYHRRTGRNLRRADSYWRSLVNDSEPSFHAPFCCTYTSVTMKGLLTSLPPTTASRRILLRTIAVEPMIRAD